MPGKSKIYDRVLAEETAPSEKEWIYIDCPHVLLTSYNEKKDEKGVDCYMGIKEAPCGFTEVENRFKSWVSHEWPGWDTATVLGKKDKYSKLEAPCFFVGYNKRGTNAYTVILDETTLVGNPKEYFRSANSIAPEHDTRYEIPIEKCAWGINNIEPYILEKCLAMGIDPRKDPKDVKIIELCDDPRYEDIMRAKEDAADEVLHLW